MLPMGRSRVQTHAVSVHNWFPSWLGVYTNLDNEQPSLRRSLEFEVHTKHAIDCVVVQQLVSSLLYTNFHLRFIHSVM